MEPQTCKQRIDGFCKFLWNSETKEFLGRGGKSWAEIGFFYLIYYICLAGFWAATMAVFYQTMSNTEPKLTGDDSLLKGNPGMGYQPMPDIDTTLIRSKTGDKNVESMVASINKVLAPYNNTQEKLDECANINTPREGDAGKKPCKVDFDELTAQCNEKNEYGIKDGKPCVLLKLNKIFNWIPKLYKDKPKDLVLPNNTDYSTTQVWISCQGENQADRENIGPLKYYPQQGFSLKYYPYMMQDGYLPPLVFVQFENPTKHLALMIECKAYAENIEVDPQEKQGSVHFELLQDY